MIAVSRTGVRMVESLEGLAAIAEPGVVAAMFPPPALPDWHEELAGALREHRFTIPRVVLTDVSADVAASWIRRKTGAGSLTPSTLDALCDDVAALLDAAAALSGSGRLMVRMLTATPDTHCGYHVDTTRPGVAPWGVLKTYHGAGTTYVDPTHVSSTRDFYRYLSRRERLVRDLEAAPDEATADRVRREIATLDNEPGFYSSDEALALAPAWSTVAFKHLDASLMWANHRPDLAWIHCSPMTGEPRFVVNVTGRDQLSRRSPATAGASAR